MTDERMTVALAQWQEHRTNHRLSKDPTCVYCNDDPRWAPGNTWDHEANVIYAPKGD